MFCLTGYYFPDIIITILILMVPINLVHQLIHGIAYSLFGGRIKFGFKGICAYTQEVSGSVLHRTKFLALLLAPSTVILVLTIFIPNSIGTVIFLFNLLGSIGDILWLFIYVRVIIIVMLQIKIMDLILFNSTAKGYKTNKKVK